MSWDLSLWKERGGEGTAPCGPASKRRACAHHVLFGLSPESALVASAELDAFAAEENV